jgi:hypothetical protein
LQSPAFGISVDEKDAHIVFLITYLQRNGQAHTVPVLYEPLPGLDAVDVFGCVEQFVTKNELDTEKFLAFTADGASVMGTRRALGDVTGDNVAAHLRRRSGHFFHVTHCAPHRLQLCVQDAYCKTRIRKARPKQDKNQTDRTSRSQTKTRPTRPD